MPPLKTYIFEHFTMRNVKITIETYSYLAAMERLTEITKHPADYKCINV